jgi:hypothetical protein
VIGGEGEGEIKADQMKLSIKSFEVEGESYCCFGAKSPASFLSLSLKSIKTLESDHYYKRRLLCSSQPKETQI